MSKELNELFERLGAVSGDYIAAIYFEKDIPKSRQLLKQTILQPLVPPEVIVEVVNADGAVAEWVYWRDSDLSSRIVYFHGGGYIGGDVDMYRPFAAELARVTGSAVLNVEYRLAPEHPFDVPTADGDKAYGFAVAQGPAQSGPAARIFVAGDSAGAGVAINVAQLHKTKRCPDGVIALSAAVDLAGDKSMIPHDQWPMFDYVQKLFLRDTPSDHPIASPINGDLSGLPPLFIQTSRADMAFASNSKFGDKARAHGVAVNFDIWDGVPHDWQIQAPYLPEASQALDSIRLFVEKIK